MKCPYLIYFASLIVLTGGCEAEGIQGSLADLSIVDRDSGDVLHSYIHHGEYWVAGRPGARYAVEVRNHLDERLLVVMSVDGINVVSGETAAWDQTGYVFHPSEQYQVTGWRKSDTEIAAFTFTDSSNSYAERTGRPANVGVIGVALFREREPVTVPARVAPSTRESEMRAYAGVQAGRAGPTPKLESIAPPPSAAPSPAPAPSFNALAAAAAVAPENKLGTGHGEREFSYIGQTVFMRMQARPNEILRIHYDSRANLIAMGIIPRTRPTMPPTDPFPRSGESYVPDPPG
jgi:hypothetical protein